MLDQVQAALAAIKSEGSFAVELACPSTDLAITVKGLGPLRFPLSATTARSLLALAAPAPFGRRDKTLRDARVRDTWQIARTKLAIDTRAWDRTLAPTLATVREKLGLSPHGKLVAVLDKMLVYTPGQFFAAHQDSERDDDMVGSLVLTLPSASSGGEVVVQHHGEKKSFRGKKRGPRDLSVLAFYADCHHEVRPITSGYRVVLTYHLLHRVDARARPAPPSDSAAVDHLTERVKRYFATPYPNAPAERPDRLVYLLDHQYTEKSLGWTRLKNGDRLRVSALRRAAERLDCECWLTLADVHENWTCEGDDWDYGRHRDEDDKDDDADAGEYELIELCDSNVELRHWVGQGNDESPSIPVVPSFDEICFTKASVDLEPFKSEHEGYMGNYGNTVDRWYHRAALVMWPRERDFVMRAKMSPAWAVKELAARPLPSAREGARSLLPFWARDAGAEQSRAFFSRLMKLSLALDDGELAHALLAPFGPDRLSVPGLPTFAAIVERYGLAWSKDLFAKWRRGKAETPTWTRIVPELVSTLLRSAPTHGRAFAAWLLTREVSLFGQARNAELAGWVISDKVGEHTDRLFSLFAGAAALDAASTREHLVALATTGQTALPLADLGALLEACREDRTPSAVRALGLDSLFEYVVKELERALARPTRSPSDWSIEVPLRCKCDLCKTLEVFLRAPDRVEHAWPLAEARRSHVHDAIARHRLPVSHATRRTGSPYTLVLTKQNELFAREAAVRAQYAALLTWLSKNRKAFIASSKSDAP